jgi:hypothetical protein
MMKLGAVSEPMFPRKLASERIYAGQDCVSAATGMSASEVGISGTLVLLDMDDVFNPLEVFFCPSVVLKTRCGIVVVADRCEAIDDAQMRGKKSICRVKP